MTDRLPLGITVGASRSVAVATTADGGVPVAVIQRPSVVEVAPGYALDGFLARVGDPVPMLADDGSIHAAADLVARTTTSLITDIAAETGAEPTVIACHPGWWADDQVRAVRDALDAADAGTTVLIPEPLAVLRRYEAEHGLLDDGALIVYDLGASGLTVSVVRTGDESGLLGTPTHSDTIAGAEFDLLTMRYVLAHALGDTEFDPFDPVVEAELAALRERCRIAKEELSRDTATVVSVGALGTGGPVRIVRGEFEDVVRADLRDSLDLVRTAVRQAGIEFGDVRAVLLTGGGGAIPLVAELVSAEFGLPVVACADPATASAAGAAELAADLLASESSYGAVSSGELAYSAYTEPVSAHSGESPMAGVAAAEPGLFDDERFGGSSDDRRADTGSELAETASSSRRDDRTTPGYRSGESSGANRLADKGYSGDISLFADTGLPEDDEASPRKSRKRLAVVAAALAAFGALTAATIALAPQFGSASTPTPSSADAAATSSGAPATNAVTPIAAVDAEGKTVLGTPTLDADGKPVPGAPLLDADGQPIPGTVTPAVTTPNSVQPNQTQAANGAPQGGAPQGEASAGGTPQGGAPQPGSPQAGTPQSPAPEQTPPSQNSPAPAPPAQTPPTTTSPAPAPQQPQQPQYPNLGQVPGKIIDGAGEVVEGTVGGVTKLPGELLGGGN
ncbi:Hsp70 family protein [Nocardia sp. AG03]|uniref:Hsp70 family protein n=1 Tax=Nocardia sp. AG03 TaxID=3025312 RepID=UPI0024189FE5|nr:Hsp70 family protein [Nocardia sp. AG03]